MRFVSKCTKEGMVGGRRSRNRFIAQRLFLFTLLEVIVMLSRVSKENGFSTYQIYLRFIKRHASWPLHPTSYRDFTKRHVTQMTERFNSFMNENQSIMGDN